MERAGPVPSGIFELLNSACKKATAQAPNDLSESMVGVPRPNPAPKCMLAAGLDRFHPHDVPGRPDRAISFVVEIEFGQLPFQLLRAFRIGTKGDDTDA
jgi:hypothetical protein